MACTKDPDQELARLIAYLAPRAKIMACLLPDIFDGYSAADLVQDVIVDYWRHKLVFDPGRGASVETFLATVMARRLIDRKRRSYKLIPLDAINAHRDSRSRSAPPHVSPDPNRQMLRDTIERLAKDDPEVRELLAALEELEDIPQDLNRVLATAVNRPVRWVENVKRRIKYALEQRRQRSAVKSLSPLPARDKRSLL
jgi:DNA-directed RNA polymerase specialized sigma24 family protein